METETGTKCRGCGNNDADMSERIVRMIAAAKFDEGDCVSDAIYERRLASCTSCSLLSGGYTCLVCGCIVQIRARLMAKRCPKPEGSLWEWGTSS